VTRTRLRGAGSFSLPPQAPDTEFSPPHLEPFHITVPAPPYLTVPHPAPPFSPPPPSGLTVAGSTVIAVSPDGMAGPAQSTPRGEQRSAVSGIAPPPPPPPPPAPPRPPGLPTLQQQVRQKIAAWRRIGAPNHVLRWLREGVRCDWIAEPPPPFHHGISRVAADDLEWISAERDRCIQTGAWCRATCTDYVSKAFIVTHNGKRRLVFNLKYLNSFHTKRSCRFGSLSALRRVMHEGDWMWSIDLSDAYHHIGIHHEEQKYFTFAIETDAGVEYFSTSALNFGWCRSPQVFTDVMKVVVAYLRNPAVARGSLDGGQTSELGLASPHQPRGPRAPGVSSPAPRVLPWLDDFAFFFRGSQEQAIVQRDRSFDTFALLGITQNFTKGQPEPSTMLHDHLGYGIDSASMRFLLTTKREQKLRRGAISILSHAARHGRRVGKRPLAALAGLAQSSELALPLVRLWLRSSYDDISSRPGWSGDVRLSHQSMADLRQLTTLRESKHVGKPIALRPDTAVGSVDAGPYGWGGQLERGQTPVAGFWCAWEAAKHITWRELRAVRLFIEAHLEQLAGRRLLLHEDNTAVVAITHSFTSKSRELMAELRLLVAVLDENDTSLRTRYIRSADNVVADYYSRIAQAREYQIDPLIFEEVAGYWGACSLDAFASEASAMLPRYWAEAAGSAALAVDAFAQDWESEALVWAHPPPSQLPQLVQLLRTRPAVAAVVCVPHWPGSQWFRELMEMAVEMATFPPGSFQRVAFDAPQLLESWGATVFLVRSR
jgi:hypothetical protein